MPARHRQTYGQIAPDLDPPFPRPADDIALSTPVGVLQDRAGRVWVADAGNSRLLVFDRSLDRVLGQVGSYGTAPGEFDLPFRLAHHPSDRRVFVTDLGNERVQELAYGDGADGLDVTVEGVFSTDADQFHPNGIAVSGSGGSLTVFVADEFYHEDPTDTRSRIVVFDGDGTQRGDFRCVRDGRDGIGLYWPQGLDTDADGNLLIANTGYGQQAKSGGRPAYYSNVLRCDSTGEGVPFARTGSAVLDDGFAIPRAVSYLPAADRIVVPDIAGGYLYAYSPAGDRRGEVPSTIAPEIRRRRFDAPMAVCGYDPGPEAESLGSIRARVLVTEALDHAVSAYTLRLVAERKAQTGTVDGLRGEAGQFDYASGSAVQFPADERVLWVGDGGNTRAQYTEPAFDDPITPADLPANRFPATVETWHPTDDETYLFVADYFADAAAFDDDEQIHCYRVDGRTPEHVVGFGSWGYFPGSTRLPRGMDVEPLGEDRARLHVADSLNGRIATWTVDRHTEGVVDSDTYGHFGHDAGEFWLPSDVAVGPEATYVADRSNDRLQYDAGGGWQVLGEAGYGDDSGRFLLPTSMAYADGYLFVVDLVNRAIKVFEPRADGSLPEKPVDSFGTFGGQTAGGDLWFPAMVSAVGLDDGVSVFLPDSVLNVVYRFEWTPP
jgi:DNA-binding beta-propeller fold protein YncE